MGVSETEELKSPNPITLWLILHNIFYFRHNYQQPDCSWYTMLYSIYIIILFLYFRLHWHLVDCSDCYYLRLCHPDIQNPHLQCFLDNSQVHLHPLCIDLTAWEHQIGSGKPIKTSHSENHFFLNRISSFLKSKLPETMLQKNRGGNKLFAWGLCSRHF